MRGLIPWARSRHWDFGVKVAPGWSLLWGEPSRAAQPHPPGEETLPLPPPTAAPRWDSALSPK